MLQLNISICCAMSVEGMVEYQTQAFALNVESFISFLRSFFQKLQSNNINNAIFIMDNVPFHTNQQVKNFILERGYQYDYLPPYSQFLNQIKNLFCKWKDYTKELNPNNEAELIAGIENGRELITRSDCEGYFRNMTRYISRSISGEVIDN